MSVFLIVLVLLCLYGIKFNFHDGFEDYCSPAKTGSIKGIFVFIVVLSHARQYITVDNGILLNKPYLIAMDLLGQLMVVMFLFYSGYGVALAIKKKDGYAKSIPVKRAFKVWYHFAVAVCIFFGVGLAIGRKYTFIRLLQSFIGYKDVGNSAWFIIDIIILYLITHACFMVATKKHLIAGISAVTVCSVVLVAVMRIAGKDNWWYDTVMCYPLGMWFSLFKNKLDSKVLPSLSKWLVCTILTAGVFAGTFAAFRITSSRSLFIISSLFFAFTIVFISMRVSIDNAVLRWFGKRVFGIYILQRIPMILLRNFSMNSSPVLFTAASFAVTLVIAELFERLMQKSDILLRLANTKAK